MTGRQWLGITTPNWCIWSDAPRSHKAFVSMWNALIDSDPPEQILAA
jgi:hypothetical protein